MKKTKQTIAVLSALIALSHSSAQAEPLHAGQSSSAFAGENRIAHRLGAYVGILGDPHPTVAGINFAYNVNEFMRASVGFGKVSVSSGVTVSGGGFSISTEDQSMTTLGAAVKFLMPNWNLSPAVTVGYSHVSIDEGIQLADYKTNNIYLGLGADWQAENGFNFGAGMNLSMNSAAPSAPYINVGMFF